MSKISLYVWGWGLGVWLVGYTYTHTLVKNLLIKFLMMLFLVAKGCKFDSCAGNLLKVDKITQLIIAGCRKIRQSSSLSPK